MKVEFVQLQSHGDERGKLVALEENKNTPFEIKRVYYMFNTKSGVRRGFHAHKELNQLAITVRGSCRFYLDDGKEKIDITLDSPSQGLLLEPYVWHEMYDFSEDCVLMILADKYYDESDYIRSYEEFLEEAKCNVHSPAK
ncbi:sugar 3,4-ketoisomerase [Serratia oryzae]|uniref:sugar 3,4-ketoisomerase n=1 Tax=Serratia oryzae TaxID=2034155 RepID=UPI0012E28CDE|nr:FdtA/QdtA family cupin domain-containing protein [Serratia oryzae]